MRKKEYEVASPKPTPSLSMDRRTLLKTGAATAAALGLSRTPALGAPIENLGFCPTYVAINENIHLFGLDFGADLANISIKASGDNNFYGGFLHPLAFEGQEVVASLSSLSPGTNQAAVKVSFGSGAFLMPTNLPFGLAINRPIRVWMGQGDAAFTSYQKLAFPAYGSTLCDESWHTLTSGSLYGEFYVPFDANCCPICPSGAKITLRFWANSSENVQSFAYDATLITTTPLYPSHIADAICTIMVSAFNSQFGVELVCQQSSPNLHQSNFTITGPNGALFHSGLTQVVIQQPGQECDSIQPDSVSKDSVPPDSVLPDSASCESMSPDCDSIAIDFVPFIFN